MDKESLKIARRILVEGLDRAKMNKQDRAELLINLWILLDDANYEHDIDVLRRYGKGGKNGKNR